MDIDPPFTIMWTDNNDEQQQLITLHSDGTCHPNWPAIEASVKGAPIQQGISPMCAVMYIFLALRDGKTTRLH